MPSRPLLLAGLHGPPGGIRTPDPCISSTGLILVSLNQNGFREKVAIGSLGNVRIETLSAFTEDQYRDLVGQLP